eukprot:364283-Chlamydomonas_euryale.AAC.22
MAGPARGLDLAIRETGMLKDQRMRAVATQAGARRGHTCWAASWMKVKCGCLQQGRIAAVWPQLLTSTASTSPLQRAPLNRRCSANNADQGLPDRLCSMHSNEQMRLSG